MTIDIKEAPHTRRDARAAVPKAMRAAAIERFGGPEVLTVLEAPVPDLEPGEVLIEVNTAGVGGWDAMDSCDSNGVNRPTLTEISLKYCFETNNKI